MTVVTLVRSNYRDPVTTLRILADEIEAGKYGDVGCLGLVLLGNELQVFGMGRDSEGPSVALLLHAGFLRLSRAIEEHGR
jgi:hypothetical protein